ncbi:MAG: metallophosphatase family protein [Meiothermus sp.]|uniref:metallophosphoesterase family protein n=1 Tax=Meiothermus sp. TaxID=1955249 RepID=UPI0025FB4929|nr:metallophosphoesterase family protein [Meiothermus sp.]MCS7195318.1 metallophosphatase family protein [Meiothermus sp.]MCX7740516.1 metallophosphatase family protein [Meiothermus sp.]
MRLLLLSDIHANPWALEAIERQVGRVDGVLFAGDAVNYGPEPGAVLDWLLERRAVGVRGNHDQAVAFGTDPQATPAKAALARKLANWAREQLSSGQVAYLRSLPLHLIWEALGLRVELVHATPHDPLYDYRLRPETDETLLAELCAGSKAPLLLVGHTHLPLLRQAGKLRVVNPGSAGQPLDGDPRAAYALLEGEALQLRRAEYDRAPLFRALQRLPLTPVEQEALYQIYWQAQL